MDPIGGEDVKAWASSSARPFDANNLENLMASKKTNSAPELISVRALTPIHDGDTLYLPGDLLELAKAQADELVALVPPAIEIVSSDVSPIR